MKHCIAIVALCLAASAPVLAQQTKRVMTVVQKDGTKTVYKVDGVQNVTFTDVELAALKNQIAFNDDVAAVSKVAMLQTADANVFSLYAENAAAEAEAEPLLKITVPQSLMGTSVELGTDETERVQVEYKGEEVKLSGTMSAKFDKFKKNITISLESETAEYDDLRCKYSGSFVQEYASANSISVTNVGETAEFGIASALVMKPTTVGGTTCFAFGDVEAADAEGMLAGKVGVKLGISASKLYNGTIDMADDAESYTFQYIDYATRIVYDKVKSGTVTTAQNSEGKVYVKISATLVDNRVVELEYYGAVTEVESLDAMTPAAVAEKAYKYYNADGEVSLGKDLGTSYLDEYKGSYTFYLIPEGDTKYSSNKVELKVSEDLINAGEVQLSTLADKDCTSTFSLKFNAGSMQLQSYAAGHGYGLMPDNGTLTITKDDDGNYSIALDVYNNYTTLNYDGSMRTGGDNTRLVLNYQGTFEAY